MVVRDLWAVFHGVVRGRQRVNDGDLCRRICERKMVGERDARWLVLVNDGGFSFFFFGFFLHSV